MAADNMAIEMVPLGETSIHIDDDDEYDVEAAMSSSMSQLIPEENPRSVTLSIKTTVVSSVRRVKSKCSSILSTIKSILYKMKLVFLISLYSVLGAYLFMWLEVPSDLAAKEDAFHQRFIAREDMLIRLRDIYVDNRENREEKWKNAILNFEKDLSLDEPVIETVWTFWMSFLYAGTIFTTIGYGNIACATTSGQVATMVYAIIGIPIMIMILNDLGDFLLLVVKGIANGVSDLCLFAGVKSGMLGLEQNSEQRVQYLVFSRKMARLGLVNATSMSTVSTLHPQSEDEEEPLRDPPVFSAIFATIGWIMFAGGIFCIWEDWTWFTSIYFFFISTSTIGLGDVTPAHPEYMMATFIIVIVGLSMVNVCINLVCEKIELLYLAILTKMAEDYQRAVESGDADAVAGMMSDFQGKSKFLKSFISKNAGNKVMNQFKQEARSKGIDIPSVLTDVDPNTGLPAFANAHKEDFKEFIQAAEVKREEEEKIDRLFASKQASRRVSPIPPRIMVAVSTITEGEFVKKRKTIDQSCQSVTLLNHMETQSIPLEDLLVQCRPPLKTMDVQTTSIEDVIDALKPQSRGIDTQTSPPMEIVDEHSFGSQFSPSCSENEAQTSDVESVDEGIQTWPSMDDVFTQYDHSLLPGVDAQTEMCEMKESSCQYDLFLPPTTSSIQVDKELVDTGIQPELSSLYFEMDESESEVGEESDVGEPSELDEMLEELDYPDSEDEEIRKEEAKLLREVPDVSDIDPLGAELVDSDRQKIHEEKIRLHELKIKDVKRRKTEKAERKKRRRAELEAMKKNWQLEIEKQKKEKEEEKAQRKSGKGFRFLKSSADQVESSYFCIEGSSQTDVYDSSVSGAQCEIAEFSGKRTQTKLTCIHSSQLSALREQRRKSRASRLSSDRASGRGPSAQSVSADFVAQERPQPIKEVTKISEESGLPVAEITLDLELVSRPVDEYGLEVFDDEFGDDDVFLSEDSLSDDEMELFAIEQETQTDVTHDADAQIQLHPSDLGCQNEAFSQTEVSSFKTKTRRPTLTTRQQSVKEEATAEEATPVTHSLSEEEVRFMRESGMQTSWSGFQLPQPEEITERRDSDSDEDVEDLRFMMTSATQADIQPTTTDGISQTDVDSRSSSTQIVLETSSKETQADMEVPTDIETTTTVTQTEIETHTSETQTISKVFVERDAQHRPETSNALLQTEVDNQEFAEMESQTIILGADAECQYDLFGQATSSQTEEKELIEEESQTHLTEHREQETQHHNEYASMDVQTEESNSNETESQTSQIEKYERYTQVEMDFRISETQTENSVMEERESQTVVDFAETSVQATSQSSDAAQQSSVSSAVVDDPAFLDQDDLHFLVTSGTQAETATNSVEIQETPSTKSIAIDCCPSVESSETQYSPPVQLEMESQTDYESKKAGVQETQTTYETVNSGVDATVYSSQMEQQTEGGVTHQIVGPDEEWTPYYETDNAPLWSDFDFVAAEDEDEDYELQEGSAQTSPVLLIEGMSQTSRSLHDEEVTQTSPIPREEAETQTIQREMKDSEVMAVVKAKDNGSAQTETDKWLKVYIDELDERRRKSMLDIGIQTGVLARVQHLYGKKVALSSEDESIESATTTESQRIQLRRLESMEHGMKRASSDESLSFKRVNEPGTSRRSLGERRTSSFKKQKPSTTERHGQEKQASVFDLRSKFEISKKEPKQPEKRRDSSSE